MMDDDLKRKLNASVVAFVNAEAVRREASWPAASTTPILIAYAQSPGSDPRNRHHSRSALPHGRLHPHGPVSAGLFLCCEFSPAVEQLAAHLFSASGELDWDTASDDDPVLDLTVSDLQRMDVARKLRREERQAVIARRRTITELITPFRMAWFPNQLLHNVFKWWPPSMTTPSRNICPASIGWMNLNS
jgi:hypothetical protein